MSDTVETTEQNVGQNVDTVQQEPTPNADSMTEALQNDNSPNSMAEALQNDNEPAPNQPQEIEYTFKDKDGNDVTEGEYIGHVKGIAKDLGLSKEQAQKFYEQAQDKVNEINTQALENAKVEWINQTLADEEIGGQHLTESRTNALKAIRSFGSNEFKELLINTGIIEHPEIVRFLSRVGKATSADDKFINGAKPNSQKQSFLREIYGKNSPELFDE